MAMTMGPAKSGNRATKSGTAKRASRSKYPWERIKDHYITAENIITLRDLAEVYNCPYETMRSKAADERWTYLRTEHVTKAALAKQAKRRNTLATEAVGFDDVSLRAAKLGQSLVVGRLAQVAELFQAQGVNWRNVIEKVKQGIPLEPHETRSSINYKELVELANALDRYQSVGRRALGTDVENLNITGGLNVHDTLQVEVSIGDELNKPDLDRTSAVIEAMRRSGLEKLITGQLALPEGEGDDSDDPDAENGSQGDDEDDGVVDAEIVEE